MEEAQEVQGDQNLFSYLLILDFEATCQDKEQLKPCSQIIEFPVRVIRMADFSFLPDTFHYYIKPKHNPQLTPFCTKLTGITQQTVDKGLSLEQVIIKFDQWVKKYDGDFIFVTCGNWDLNTCLNIEAKEKNIKLNSHYRKFINIKQIFPAPKDWKGKGNQKYRAGGMTDMLYELDLQLQGRHHSGIDDTLNIGRIMIQLLKNGMRIAKENIHHVNPK